MSEKEIVWTCPNCRLRNTSEVPANASQDKTVAVTCKGCEREHSVSPALVFTANGKKHKVGVTWL